MNIIKKILIIILIIAIGLFCAVTYFAMKDDKVEFIKWVQNPNGKGIVRVNVEELYKIEDQSYVNLEKKEVYLDYKHQIDRFENEFIKQTLDVSLPNYILEHMKGRIEEYKNMQGIPEGYFDEERYIQNYAFFQYIKPIEFESVIENLIIERLNSFEFFVLENGNKLKKIVFKDCKGSHTCRQSKFSLSASCGEDECNGYVSYDNTATYFRLYEDGKLFIYNKQDKEGKNIPNIHELEYEEKNGRLYKIEDQSYVNLEKKEVYLDYKHQIDRFENEFIKQTLDVSLPNYAIEMRNNNPSSDYPGYYSRLPDDYFDEERYIQNYAFFQYIKPIEFENVRVDLRLKRINSFDFFVLEDGNKLKKIVFKDCESSYTCRQSKFSLGASCSKDECSGSISFDSAATYFRLYEDGKLFLYNEQDENGTKIPNIHEIILEEL